MSLGSCQQQVVVGDIMFRGMMYRTIKVDYIGAAAGQQGGDLCSYHVCHTLHLLDVHSVSAA